MDREDVMRTFWWSLASAAAMAGFWGIWYGIAGSVPKIAGIRLTESWAVPLPFAISRWWDVLIGAFWVWSILLGSEWKVKEGGVAFFVLSALSSLVPGFYLGISVGLGETLRGVLITTCILCLLGGIFLGAFFRWGRDEERRGIPFSFLGTWIGMGLMASIGAGGVLGFAVGLAAGMALAIISLLFWGIFAFTAISWTGIGKHIRDSWRAVRELPGRKKREFAELRREIGEHQARVREQEARYRTLEGQLSQQREQRERLQDERDHLRKLLEWYAAQQGITVEQLEARYRESLRQQEIARVLWKPVKELRLTQKTRRALADAGIEHVWQIALLTREEFEALKGTGRISQADIEGELAGLGLSIGMKITEVPPPQPPAP